MTLKLFSFLFLFFSITCFAQEYNVNGVVNDENKQPIAFSNVTLKSTMEPTLIKGTTTDEDGLFKFENIKANDYVLEVSFIGFETYKDTISVHGNINYKPIVLKEKAENLDDVTVIAKRPTVKRMIDGLVFNVENSTLSNGSVLDVLKHTPGVIVADGSITVRNSAPTVYINDRRVHLSLDDVTQLLEGTSANNIKSIEVITKPPAKYDAEGGAVINIVTSKNIIAGYKGSLFGNYKQGSEYPKYSLGTSHFFKTEKIDAYVNYNISPKKEFRQIDEFISFFDTANQPDSRWVTSSNETRKSVDQNINANIDYNFNKKNTLGLSANILMSPRNNTKTGINSTTEVFDSNNVLDSTFNTINNAVAETYNLAFTLNYVHEFDREGEKISLSTHHTDYDYSSYQDVNTGYFFPNSDVSFRDNKFQTFARQKIKLYTGQVDYELPGNDSSKFEAGLKFSSINSDNVLTQYTFQNDIKVEDLQNSDTFLYDEMNYAGYASYAKDWKTWSFKSGLRVEYTDITGNSISTNTINNSSYFKFFPSLYLLKKLNDNNELYINYNRRIYRPKYEQLNPFVFFLNDNTYRTGDPNLKPEIDDEFILGYTFNKNYTFELYYRYENNSTFQIAVQDNNNKILKYIDTNLDKAVSYGLDFTTYTKIVSRWNLYVYNSVFYYDNYFFAIESNNVPERNGKWSFYSQIGNYFTLLKDESLSLDVMYLYISPTANGATVVSTRAGLNINLKKTLWNNKASLNIGMEDVFNTQNFSTSTKYLNQDIYLKIKPENRLLVFGFNYKFGNSTLKNNQRKIDIEERDRLHK